MKGITKMLGFFIKILSIVVLVLSLLGAYFTIVDYNVKKISADPLRESLLIAEGFSNCDQLKISNYVLSKEKLHDYNGTEQLKCMKPFGYAGYESTGIKNYKIEIEIAGLKEKYIFGNMSISKKPDVTYATAIEIASNFNIPGIIKVYRGDN